MLTDAEFTLAVNHHMNTVYRTAYSWLRDSQDANDITQNVFIKLYKAREDFESDEHLKRWLVRVTKKYRVPLMLYYYEGYSLREISGMTGIPENTLSTRLSRARAQLKGILEECI